MLTHEELARIRQGGQGAVNAAVARDKKASEARETAEARKQNRDFTQVYPAGWRRLRGLMKEDPNAANLYAFFAENMGPDGTLCASRSTLAEALGIGERTVTRYVRKLESMDAIVVLKIGSANVYCLNPAEVWKSFDNAKPYAAFKTNTLVGKTENPFVRRRVATLLGGQAPEQSDLFADLPETVEPEGQAAIDAILNA